MTADPIQIRARRSDLSRRIARFYEEADYYGFVDQLRPGETIQGGIARLAEETESMLADGDYESVVYGLETFKDYDLGPELETALRSFLHELKELRRLDAKTISKNVLRSNGDGMMQLMTSEIERAFRKYPLGSQNGKGGDAKVVVKYFGGSAATWLITEGEPAMNGDYTLYGFVTLGFPDDFEPGKLLWEWGYVTLRQLQEIRFPPFGLGIERDIDVQPGKTKVSDNVFMCRQYGRN